MSYACGEERSSLTSHLFATTSLPPPSLSWLRYSDLYSDLYSEFAFGDGAMTKHRGGKRSNSPICVLFLAASHRLHSTSNSFAAEAEVGSESSTWHQGIRKAWSPERKRKKQRKRWRGSEAIRRTPHFFSSPPSPTFLPSCLPKLQSKMSDEKKRSSTSSENASPIHEKKDSSLKLDSNTQDAKLEKQVTDEEAEIIAKLGKSEIFMMFEFFEMNYISSSPSLFFSVHSQPTQAILQSRGRSERSSFRYRSRFNRLGRDFRKSSFSGSESTSIRKHARTQRRREGSLS